MRASLLKNDCITIFLNYGSYSATIINYLCVCVYVMGAVDLRDSQCIVMVYVM